MEFDRIIEAAGLTPPAVQLTLASVKAVAESDRFRLRLPEALYARVVAALNSRKHVILTGPPGTAKTTLAQVVAEAARNAGCCDGFLFTTATADWTTYETIGGLRPTARTASSSVRVTFFARSATTSGWSSTSSTAPTSTGHSASCSPSSLVRRWYCPIRGPAQSEPLALDPGRRLRRLLVPTHSRFPTGGGSSPR